MKRGEEGGEEWGEKRREGEEGRGKRTGEGENNPSEFSLSMVPIKTVKFCEIIADVLP